LELKKKNIMLRIKFHIPVQRVVATVDEPLGQIRPLIAKQFGILSNEIENYKLHLSNQAGKQKTFAVVFISLIFFLKTEVSFDKSIREQNLFVDQLFYLLHKDEDKSVIEADKLNHNTEYHFEPVQTPVSEKESKKKLPTPASLPSSGTNNNNEKKEEEIDLQHVRFLFHF
jgi:hypothetical protein